MPGLHDPLAVDLGEVVVGEEEVHLGGEVALEVGRPDEHLPTVFGAVLVEVLAMDHFMEHDVPLRVVGQVGGDDELFEVPPVVVQVAGHPDFALGRQVDHLPGTGRGDLVFLGGGFQRFDDLIDLIVGERHGLSRNCSPALRQCRPRSGMRRGRNRFDCGAA